MLMPLSRHAATAATATASSSHALFWTVYTFLQAIGEIRNHSNILQLSLSSSEIYDPSINDKANANSKYYWKPGHQICSFRAEKLEEIHLLKLEDQIIHEPDAFETDLVHIVISETEFIQNVQNHDLSHDSNFTFFTLLKLVVKKPRKIHGETTTVLIQILGRENSEQIISYFSYLFPISPAAGEQRLLCPNLVSGFYLLIDDKLFELYCLKSQTDFRSFFEPISIDLRLRDSRRLLTLSKLGRRSKFSGVELTTGHLKKFNMTSRNGQETLRPELGMDTISYQYLAFAQDFFNFSVRALSSQFGRLNQSSGRWDGIAGHLQKNEYDFVMVAGTMLGYRTKYFRYLSPYTTEDVISVLFKKQKSYNFDSSFFYTRIFSRSVWICMLASFVAIATIFSLLMVIRHNSNRNGQPGQEQELVFWLIACITQKDFQIQIVNSRLSSMSIQIILLSTKLFCLILYIIFSAQLVSTLSTKTPFHSSISKLIADGYTFGMQVDSDLIVATIDNTTTTSNTSSSSSTSKEFLKTNHTETDDLFANLDPINAFEEFENGLSLVLNSTNKKYAFLCDSVQEQYEILGKYFSTPSASLSERTTCEEFAFFMVPGYNTKFSAFVLKDSQLGNHFNYARITMKERGISKFHENLLARLYDEQKPQCMKPKLNYEGKVFEIYDLMFAYIILAGGLIFSLVILAFEYLKYLLHLKSSFLK